MDTVNQFIATSLAIKVFKYDQKLFNDFKMGMVYLDVTDAVIDRLYEDFNNLKRDMYAVHHIDIRQLDETKYIVKSRDKNEVSEYTPEQLKQMTSDVMDRCLNGDKAGPYERMDRRWDVLKGLDTHYERSERSTHPKR
ncbi:MULTISPECIES: hypothetical protein [Oceanobacillus]|uniref:Uncharacterized protein n=1 Tax=Oceanobacillus profundus TaxID=372463 RepID=A0A417YF38_9BACI|nr:hypothetical protein [Oceanobacillus profundus]MCM3397247.1 hypothetical protein [Oceanobacillus profundus]PAE28630.1 hypothetical protein CHI07_13060 [Paenibacillus sp. 7884-2]RHW31266.1 hypothetical protein D1B32_13770 [Oceanobacillus profundus]